MVFELVMNKMLITLKIYVELKSLNVQQEVVYTIKKQGHKSVL